MLAAALNHGQLRSAERRGGGTPVAASHARHTAIDHSKRRVSSSLPTARCEKPRANSGVLTRPGFFFTPRAVTIDEILELRLCDLTGRQPVINRSRLDTLGNQPPAKFADLPVTHSNVPSAAHVLDDRDRDREVQGSVPIRQGVLPKSGGAFQHEFR